MNSRALKRLPARFYRANSGREPVREWLKSLDPEDRRTVGEDIKDVEFVADWYAAGTVARPRAVGSPKQLAARSYRARDFLR